MSEQNGEEAKEEQEEALVALIEHRTKEVEHLQKRISYYKSQLEQAEKRLKDSESKLTRLRRGENTTVTAALDNGHKKVKEERRSRSLVQTTEIAPKSRSHSRPELLIPAVKPTISQTVKIEPDLKASTSSAAQTNSSHPVHSHGVEKSKGEKHSRDQEATEVRDKGTKRKFEQKDKKEHKELVPFVRSCSSPDLICCYSSSLISSQHKRKLRSLALYPGNDQLFVTSMSKLAAEYRQTLGEGASGVGGAGGSRDARAPTSQAPQLDKGKRKIVHRSKKRRSDDLPSFGAYAEPVLHSDEGPAFDPSTQSEKGPIYIPNWGITVADSGFDRPYYAREVLDQMVLPKDRRYLSTFSNEVHVAKGMEHMYKALIYYSTGMKRLEDLSLGTKTLIEERRNLMTRVEILEKKFEDSYDRERVRAEKDAVELQTLRRENEEQRVKIERLKSMIGTTDAPGEVVRAAVEAAEEALIVRLADLNDKLIRESFEQCKSKMQRLYPDCDFSAVHYESDGDQDAPDAERGDERDESSSSLSSFV